MSVQRKPDMQHLPPDIDRFFGRTHRYHSQCLPGKLDIDSVRALELFYESETCKHLHDKTTGLYLFGDLYIAEEFLQELQKRQ